MFCKYKNIFGAVGEGIHSYRIWDIAIVDLLLTVLLAYIIYIFIPHYTFIAILILLLTIGIICHRIFCVRTTVDKLLFPE
jgi:hypothetical protein